MYLAAWFSDMGWREVIVALAPIFVVMWLVHRYEESAGTPAYASLKPEAKGWLLLVGLPAAVAAKLMSQMEAAVLRSYMAAGAELAPKADRHFSKVVREFAKGTPEADIGGEDALSGLCDFASEHPAETVQALTKLWPAARAVNVPSEEQAQAAQEAQKQMAEQAGQMAPLQACAAPNLEPCAELKPIAVLDEEPEKAAP